MRRKKKMVKIKLKPGTKIGHTITNIGPRGKKTVVSRGYTTVGEDMRDLLDVDELTESKALPIPTVHSNGTGAKGLRDQLIAVSRGLRSAMDAMGQAMPHGRDYYPQGDNALSDARKAHQDLIKQVSDIEKKYRVMGIGVSKAARGSR
jgi:hypothetical protein